MEIFEYCAPCLFGVEGILGDELRRLGAADVRPENGRVLFRGDVSMMARANICSRYAERIQLLMGRFTARSFEELFQGTKDLPWERFISRQDAFPVKGWSLNSQLHSVPDCQAIVKKAVVERLKRVYGIQWFDECDGKCQIQFTIMKDEVTLLLDTSGVGLHKRGYRAVSGGAPIKETLAAAIVDVTRARRARLVCDPCCGSGTLLIREISTEVRLEDAAATVEELSQKLATGRADPAAARDELLHTMACKSAIKAGMTTDTKELQALVEKVQAGEILYCPHGRPVKHKLSKYEIEKLFKRA